MGAKIRETVFKEEAERQKELQKDCTFIMSGISQDYMLTFHS